MNTHNGTGSGNNYHILKARVGFVVLLKVLLTLVILGLCTAYEVKAQVNVVGEKADTSFHYDEINVTLMIEGYGNFNLDVIYTENNHLYVNVEELFKTISVPYIAGNKGDSIGGFIELESKPYLINYQTKQIRVGDKQITSGKALIKEMGALFMESTIFGEMFGLTLTFNYRALAVVLKSNFELPVIKNMRLEKLRNSISKLKGSITIDTTAARKYHIFRFGMVDWVIASNQIWQGLTSNHFSFGVGSELLFGEADLVVNYYDRQKFDNRQVQYQWRWVDNDKKIVKQAQVGNISLQTTAFINVPIIGAVIRNAPSTIRKATGYYTIREITEPNWTVELYINNILMDFTKADASGLYIFKVPIVYGYTTLKLKFYGPMGEERTEERTLNVPYTIMPAKEFEYSLAAGLLQDNKLNRFGKADFNYGVNRFLTIGGGVEYLTSIKKNAVIPLVKMTIQPLSRLLITGEYAHGVKSHGVINYYFMKSAFLEVDYTKYVEGQAAIPFKSLEERTAKLSVPFGIKKLSGNANLDFTQLVYKGFTYNQGNAVISLYYRQFSLNSSTHLNWIDRETPYVFTDLSLSYRLQSGYNMLVSSQYNLNAARIITGKAEFEKRIPNGYITATYERNFAYKSNSITLSFKYDLNFARTNITASFNNGKITTSQGLQGSLAFAGGKHYIHASNTLSVNKGGLSLYPFLDLNNNGIMDAGEQMVKISSVKIMGSNVIFREKDSTLRISDLIAFTNYIVEFSDNDLDNIAWRFKKKIYSIHVDPNQFKRVDIPIIAVGEVSGMIYLGKNNLIKGIGRILVKIYRKNNNALVAETLSESDGYIYYMGLSPGDYIVRVDEGQLGNLGMTADPPLREFTLKQSPDGDMVGNIDFVLSGK
ncbi:MAG: hypothetical protein WCK34_01450 [Bacteroidota bacterium]